MRVRGLLFILILYVLLVWIVAVYLETDLVNRGLIGTAFGIAALLVWLVGVRIVDWRKERNTVRVATPAGPPASAKSVHEDDRALAALLLEAEQRLASAPGGKGAARSLAELPVYLLIGPEGAGKTAVFQNSGLEPYLLAGQVAAGGGDLAPTRVANIWLANQALFIEIAGRIATGDSARWAEFLQVLLPASRMPAWQKWLKPSAQDLAIQGIILVFDGRRFQGTPELDRVSQQLRESLQSACNGLGVSFPVYVLFTRLDAIPFFSEFMGGVSEAELRQAFGVLKVPVDPKQAENKVWAETETKLLNRLFNSIFLCLSDRRSLALANESYPEKRPAIYEFPREFKRIRTSLVQFLVDVFKPDPLRLSPSLRGFFFTGTKKVERNFVSADDTQSNVRGRQHGGGATQIFRPEATQMFSADNPVMRAYASSSDGLIDRWVFATAFFLKVASDRPIISRIASDDYGWASYRKLAIPIGVLAGLAAMVWALSWLGNRQLVKGVENAATEIRSGSSELSLRNLRSLGGLRQEITRLEEDNSLRLHWGLYSGDDLLPLARRVYYERLRVLALDGLNRSLAVRLREPATTESYDSVYKKLKTHLTITNKSCPVQKGEILSVLNGQVPGTFAGLDGEQQKLLSDHLDYYVSRLEAGNEVPIMLTQDAESIRKAREYLSQATGVEQLLRGLLTEVGRKVPNLTVEAAVPGYRAVLDGPAEIPGAFTRAGADQFEALIGKGATASGGEECVTGKSSNMVSDRIQGSETVTKLRSLYYRQYANTWKAFLASFSVKPFGGLNDSVQRLEVLSGPQSPMLAIVKLVARNCNFPPAKAGQPSNLDAAMPKIGMFDKLLRRKKQATQLAAKLDTSMVQSSDLTSGDVWRLFQPARYTASPESDQIVEKNNEAYILGIRGLKKGLNDLALAADEEKPSLVAPARSALDQAFASHAALSDNFSDAGNEGVNRQLSDLLRQPLRWAEKGIPSNAANYSSGLLNGQLKVFCEEIAPVLRKFPFNPRTTVDANLTDIQSIFAPGTGKVWTYRLKSLGSLTENREQRWQQKADSPKPVVAAPLLTFFNRAQQLTDAFYPPGAARPDLQYTLRPTGNGPQIRLSIDGAEINSKESIMQKSFRWPARPGVTSGAQGSVVSSEDEMGFGSYGGLWAVFRLFYEADARDLNDGLVKWSRSRGQGQQAEAQTMRRPVTVQILAFPGGVDLFNPQFFAGLKCPGKALE